MYNKITNPKSGRKVSIYGSLGRKVLRNYLKAVQLGGGCVPGDCGGEKTPWNSCKSKGCEYIKKEEVASKGVSEYGCYKCDEGSAPTGDDDDDDGRPFIAPKMDANCGDDPGNDSDRITLFTSMGERIDSTSESGVFPSESRRTVSEYGSIINNPLRPTSNDYAALGQLQWNNHSTRRLYDNPNEEQARVLGDFTVNAKVLSKLNSEKYTWVDQGSVGGCAFACISHLCQLGNIQTPWDISRLTSEGGFADVYLSGRSDDYPDPKKVYGGYGCDDSGYNDWITAFAIDLCPRVPRMREVIEHIHLIATKLGRRGSHNLRIGDAGMSNTEYGQAVFDYIKGLLDKGYAVGISFLNHFITVIGYKTVIGKNPSDQLLFLGSYGDSYDHGALHIMESTFSAAHVGDALASIIYVKVK